MIKNQTPDGWLRAVDEALVVTHLGVANAEDSYETAKRKLNELICWHVAVALDPAVSEDAVAGPVNEIGPVSRKRFIALAEKMKETPETKP